MSGPSASPVGSKSDDEFSASNLHTDIPASDEGLELAQNPPSLASTEECADHKNLLQEDGCRPTTENTGDNTETREIVEGSAEELDDDQAGVSDSKPDTQAIDEADDDAADCPLVPPGEAMEEEKEKDVLPNLQVLDDDSDTVTETIDNLEAFEIDDDGDDDDDDAPAVEKPSPEVTAPPSPPPPPSASPSTTSSSSSSSTTSTD